MRDLKFDPETGRDVRASIDALEARLADGYARIEAAQTAGLDVVAWEGFWLELLRQYEAASDALHGAEAA